MVNYLTDSIKTYYKSYASTAIGVAGVNILLIFSVLLMFVAPKTDKNKEKEKKSLLVNNKYNPIIVIGLIVVLVFTWIYGFVRPDLPGERGTPSALYEYSLIFIIISLYYVGDNSILKYIVVTIAAAFALQNFVYGGRITGLQIVVLVVISLYVDKLSLKKVIPTGMVFFVVMSLIGQFRAQLIMHGANIKAVVKSLSANYFSLDTAYSSYYTSMTFLDELTQTDFNKRIYLFGRWLLSIVLGGRVSDSNLALYTRQHHFHYNGGVLPFFAWFYLGLLGVVLLTIYLGFLLKIINNSNSERSGLIRCLAIYICATTARWYLYSPSQIFRGLILFCLVYAFAYLVDSVKISKEKHFNRLEIKEKISQE